VPVPLQAPSWDTSGLVQALQATSLQQNANSGQWYMDSNALSHKTEEQGNMTKYFPLLLHNFSQVVVGNGSKLPILGTGYTHIGAPNINFLLASILDTPSFVSNLISVCKFTRDNLCSVEFDSLGLVFM
jgi:hypothetical protein